MQLRSSKQTDDIARLHSNGLTLPPALDAYDRLRHRLATFIEEKIVLPPEEFSIEFDPYEKKWVVSGTCKLYLFSMQVMCVSQTWCLKFDHTELEMPVDVFLKIQAKYEATVAVVRRAANAVQGEFKEEILAEVFG